MSRLTGVILMANPISSIFHSVSSAINSITTVIDTTASATDNGMATLDLHAKEYRKRVEHDYKTDFTIYKMEKDVADKERVYDLIERQTKLVDKITEQAADKDFAAQRTEKLAQLDALFSAAMEHAESL